MSADRALAARLLALLDLTNLDEDASPAAIEQLCGDAASGPVLPAAVCVYPEHVTTARRELDAAGAPAVAVATVVNFPDGADDAGRAVRETRRALAAGAGEIDLVFPWRAYVGGDRDGGREMVQRCKETCGARPLKVIIESGELGDLLLVREVSAVALAAGADFIKTSTGKMRSGATPEAARAMLETIRTHGRAGFKASGGIRTLADAARYLELAGEIMGKDWATPARFRIGASSLLQELRAAV
ncbi:MAG: deoxyribose-phosphate aldolase [Steroidobacteraceae bacterium]|nr:deoxyribose-phosphate aldolase [Steroidobacteraceae bacterium]